MGRVALERVVKHYGQVTAVDGIDLEIADREFVVLVGASGCGKSTTLRMIAGLEEITAGKIWIGDRLVNELEPKNRDIAMVFQDYALYPHMSVAENMGFGLVYRKVPKAEIRRRVDEAARILDIGGLLDRRPKQLSGGQRQRVAMGRAIVRNPQVFLFDEPLSNLDAKLRVQMRTEIKKLHQRVATTVVYVTHDQVEAMTLADRIVLMRDGRIEQCGTPDELYNHPATAFVASFIGAPQMNLLPGELVIDGEAAAVRLGDGSVWALPERPPGRAGPVTIGLRPECFAWEDQGGPSFEADVEVVEPLGSDTLVIVSIAGKELIARLPPRLEVRAGRRLRLWPDMEQLHVFDAKSGAAIR